MWPDLARAPGPFGPVTVHGWGLMAGLGWMLGWMLTAALRRGQRAAPTGVLDAWLPVGLGALGGGWGLGALLATMGGGPLAPSSSGALLGAVLGLALGSRGQPIRVHAEVADLLAPGIALAGALVSVGCWLQGCHFGIPLPEGGPGWLAAAGRFPSGSTAFGMLRAQGALPAAAAATMPLHPVQLYLGAGLLLLSLTATRRLHCLPSARRAPGSTASRAALGWAVLRLAVSPWRHPLDEARLAAGLPVEGLGALLVALLVTLTVRRLPTSWARANRGQYSDRSPQSPPPR